MTILTHDGLVFVLGMITGVISVFAFDALIYGMFGDK